MRKLTKRVYLKIRIYLIVLLSVIIGASYVFAYEEMRELRSDYIESMVIWNDYQERKGIGAVASATSQDMPQVEEVSPVMLPPEAESVEDKIRRVFGDEADNALAICECESQLEADRIGDTHMARWSYGLFQINRTWHDYPPEVLLNPDENIRIAKEIFDRGGWERWTCSHILGII